MRPHDPKPENGDDGAESRKSERNHRARAESVGSRARLDRWRSSRCGAIIRDGLTKMAAYRDENGTLYLRSAACTHLGCHALELA
jgi:hypothetical protein